MRPAGSYALSNRCAEWEDRAMAGTRWTNPHQPQTLQIAVFLLYFRGVIGVLLGTVGLIIGIAMIGGAWGIANEKRWGYAIAVIAALIALVPFVNAALDRGITDVLFSGLVLPLMFDIALVALLLHPQSRDYQRIWFR